MTDTELLEAYSSRADESAFGELTRRHGALVYRVCHRLLKDAHEAEDACQAVFVVLARKAGRLRKGDISAWLYRVAHCVAAETARKRMRRSHREKVYAENEFMSTGSCSLDDAANPEMTGLVDQALLSLPARYREAVILRYLRNHSEKEAARRAGCPVGTLSRRASVGLAKLRGQLVRRGAVMSGATLAGMLQSESHATVPETLLSSIQATVKTAASAAGAAAGASTTATMLAEGAMAMMFWKKITATVAIMAGLAAMTGGGVATYQAVQRRAMEGKREASKPIAPVQRLPDYAAASEAIYRGMLERIDKKLDEASSSGKDHDRGKLFMPQ